MKECSRCGQTKPEHEFRKRAAASSGYAGTCLVCQRARNRVECKRHRKLHPGQRATARAWASANPESVRLRTWLYKYTHPDKRRAINRARWQRIAATSDGTLTRNVLATLYVGATHCPYCREPLGDRKVLDHMTPLSRGGAHSIANVVICCAPCNQAKGDMPYDEWCDRMRPLRCA